jgi:methionyl-tRNA formyltransferase
MRVVYFGTPQFATPTLAALLRSAHTVVGVVTQPDRARGRGQHVTFAPVKQLAVAHGLTVLQPERLKTAEALDAIAALGADIGVVAAYGKLLPQALLDVPPLGMINVHASLLPRWRGAAPIHRAIQAGDSATGVTIMRVVLALDAGPMLSRVELPIDDQTSSDELETRLADAGARLLVETLDRMAIGPVAETPQDESLVTYAARLDRRDSQIDWARPARDIHNQIRAMHPWPLTSVLWRGKRLILRHSTLAPGTFVPGAPSTLVPRALPPGTLAHGALPPGTLVSTSDALLVATGTSPLAITAVQLEGRKPQTAREFINGARPAVGDRFEPVPLS